MTAGTILFAGYSGFLGRVLWSKKQTIGDRFYLLNSKGIAKSEPGKAESEVITNNPFDRGILKRILRDSDICVNFVGIVAGYRENQGIDEFFRHFAINVLFTDFLAGLAADAGTKVFILASSFGIYYRFLPFTGRLVDENAKLELPTKAISLANEGIANLRPVISGVKDARRYFEEGERTVAPYFSAQFLKEASSARLFYALCKLLAEECVAYWLPAERQRILRIGNVYSAEDDGNRIIPNFIRKIASGQDIDVFDLSRNFIYGDDFCAALGRVIGFDGPQGIVNLFSAGNTVALTDLSGKIRTHFPGSKSRTNFIPEVTEPHHEFGSKHGNLCPNSVSLDEGIKEIMRTRERRP